MTTRERVSIKLIPRRADGQQDRRGGTGVVEPVGLEYAADVTCPGRPDRGGPGYAAVYWTWAVQVSSVLSGLGGVGLVTVASGVGGGHG
jgi:hypothetical protein